MAKNAESEHSCRFKINSWVQWKKAFLFSSLHSILILKNYWSFSCFILRGSQIIIYQYRFCCLHSSWPPKTVPKNMQLIKWWKQMLEFRNKSRKESTIKCSKREWWWQFCGSWLTVVIANVLVKITSFPWHTFNLTQIHWRCEVILLQTISPLSVFFRSLNNFEA